MWREIFSEDNGRLSAMRMFAGLIIFVVLVNWTMVCWRNGNLAPLDWGAVIVLLGALGGKIAQKFAENRPTEPS